MRHLFLRRPRTERVLAATALLVGSILWADAAARRVGAAWESHRAASQERALQAEWLARAPAIEAASAKAKEGLDAGKGIDAAQLVAVAAELAGEAGLVVNSDSPKTQRSGPFTLHTVQLSARRTDLAALVRFYRLVKPRAPYLAVGGLSIQAERSGNGAVSARIQLTSVELAP
jgi:hypothetical protein